MDAQATSVPMVDRLTDAFFALDTDWRFTYLNEEAEQLWSRSRSELLGRVIWDELPEAVETGFPNGLHRAREKQAPVSFEFHHEPLDTWFEANAYPAESGLSVYVRDVTERRERETTLAQHAAVVEAVHDCVITLDRRNHIASVNEAVERTFGVDPDELVGEHVEAFSDVGGIDDETAVSIGQAINEVAAGNASRRVLEVPYVDADGEERVGELAMVPVEDETVTVAGVLHDVTDQREHERIVTSLHEITRWLLQSDDPEEICAIAVHAGSDLLDLPISGVWLLEDEHGYLDPVAGTAGAHEEFDGLPRFRQGEGLVWDTYEAGEPRLYDDVHDHADVYNPDTPIRSEIIAPIGTYGVLMTGSLEPREFDETDLDLVSTLVDNTRAALDRADRERMLRERSEQLERQTERLQAVADVLSNDLQRQLEEVATALDEDEEIDEWEFPLADDEVSTTLDRAERLVDDVREIARNAADVGLRKRIELESAIDEAITASRIESAAVVVEQSATLRADPDRFPHRLETIFDDAAARSDGNVTVQVDLLGIGERADGSRGLYLLDDGDEIPPTAHEQVLDPSADAEDAIDGLGLAVARAIAEAHGWSVSVSIGENGGTRFEIRDVTTLEPV